MSWIPALRVPLLPFTDVGHDGVVLRAADEVSDLDNRQVIRARIAGGVAAGSLERLRQAPSVTSYVTNHGDSTHLNLQSVPRLSGDMTVEVRAGDRVSLVSPKTSA